MSFSDVGPHAGILRGLLICVEIAVWKEKKGKHTDQGSNPSVTSVAGFQDELIWTLNIATLTGAKKCSI